MANLFPKSGRSHRLVRRIIDIARRVVGMNRHSVFLNRDPRYKNHDIGDWSYGNPLILDWNDGGELHIGKFCSIARDVKILVGGEHCLDWVTTYPFLELWPDTELSATARCSRSKGAVVIGNDVWIGTGVTILSGVTIGNGAVIGASSLVVKDIPAYGVAVGNPARVIRQRFPSEIVRILEEIKWWNWPEDRIRMALPLLLSSDINAFIAFGESANQTGNG